jgi:DNA-binding response OmpR family regulator
LIVDDEPDITLIYDLVLSENSFKVDSFNNPILALKYFQPGSYDLLIIDIQMPQMNGFDLYQEIRKIDNKVKIRFLITANEINFEKALPNVNCFIKKSIEKEEMIIKQVSEVIAQLE